MIAQLCNFSSAKFVAENLENALGNKVDFLYRPYRISGTTTFISNAKLSLQSYI